MLKIWGSKIWQVLNKIGLLLIYNFMWLFCCIPIITVGASTAALYRMVFNLKEERSSSMLSFFREFITNFKKATLSWVLMILFSTALVFCIKTMGRFNGAFYLLLLTSSILVAVPLLLTVVYVFPLLSYYDNSLINTWKNAFTIGLTHLPKSITIIVLQLLPLLLLAFSQELFLRVGILWFLLAPALIAYWNSAVYLKIFQSYEEQ